jgi:hypothetical protein
VLLQRFALRRRCSGSASKTAVSVTIWELPNGDNPLG